MKKKTYLPAGYKSTNKNVLCGKSDGCAEVEKRNGIEKRLSEADDVSNRSLKAKIILQCESFLRF